MVQPRTVVVLGASGFIGSAVTAAFSRQAVRLRAVSRRPIPVPSAGLAAIETVAADVTDREQLRAAVAGADVVIDLVLQSGGWRAADLDPAGSDRVNVQAMRDLVDIVGDPTGEAPPIVLYAGAVSQVGLPPDRPLDGSEMDRPVTTYDRHKLEAERVLADATKRGVVRGATLRLPTVYGASETGAVDNGVVSMMARRALEGAPITMWHDGSVRRDVLHVDDVVSAFGAAADRIDAVAGRHWLIGSGRSTPLGEIFRIVADAAAHQNGWPPVAVTSVAPPDDALVTDFHSIAIDIAPFRSRTGWRPQVSLRDGIGRTVAYLRSRALTTPRHA